MPNQSKNILVIVLLIVVAGVGFYKFALTPKRQELTQLQSDLTLAQGRLAETQAKVREYTEAKATFKQDYRSVRRLGKAVPNDDNVRTLVVELSDHAKKTKVDFQSIELSGGAGTSTPPPASASADASSTTAAALPPGASVGAAGFPTMPFAFEFNGNFFRLSKFFSKLDDMVKIKGADHDVDGRLLSVDAFSLEPTDKGFPDLKASITATAFLLPGATGGALNATEPVEAAASTSTTTPPATSSIGVVR